MKIKRMLFFLAVLSAILPTVLWGIPNIRAATPTYNMSSEFMSSGYYNNFKKVPLSGDMATDVVAIALSQLGYHEGDSNKDLGGLNRNGSRDFVEYNVLYGKLDNNQGNGVSYGYYWCASFVNWCLRQAGVSKEASAAAEVSCQRWLAKCREAEIYVEKSKHTPACGDLIFFKDAGSYVSSTHMGIVLYADEKRVYTVEGNTKNGSFSSNGNYVAIKSYSLTSSYIVGYACPKYETNDKVIPVDHSGENMSTGLYIAEADIQAYLSADMNGNALTVKAYDTFEVTAVENDRFCLLCENNGRKVEAWASLRGRARQLTADTVACTVAFLDDDGSDLLERQHLLSGGEAAIPDVRPQKKNGGFLGWSTQKGANDDLLLPGDSLGVIESDRELWAVWDYNFYLITFKSPDGELIGQKYGYYGDEFEPPIPEELPEGYVFDGWDVEELQTVITGDAVYTAVYRELAESSSESLDEASEVETNEIPTQEKGCKSAIGIAGLLIPASLCGLAFVRFKKEEK